MKLRVFLLSAVLSIISLSARAAEPAEGTPNPAIDVGERATMRGTVAQVVHRENGYIFINVGGLFPDHQFAAWIHKMDADAFPDVDSWVGRDIEFSGVAGIYNQKPMLRIRKPGDVVVVDKTDATAR